ncbi:MAG: S9 family peptidase [Parabacteroides sp.]|nr:S9 family peptidase [Parabacteroides sp.]
MKKHILLTGALCWSLLTHAGTIHIQSVHYAGPYEIQKPFMIDSTDVHSKPFSIYNTLKTPLKRELLWNSQPINNIILPNSSSEYALHQIGFVLENTTYTTAKLQIKGLKNYQIFVDNKQHNGLEITLEPSTHPIIIQYLSEAGKTDSLNICVETPNDGVIQTREDGKRLYTLSDVLHGTRFTGIELSPDGKYIITRYSTTQIGGKSSHYSLVKEINSGKIVARHTENVRWMPTSNNYYFTRSGIDGRELVSINPTNGQETILAQQLPDDYFKIAPTEDFLILIQRQEGPKERKEIYEILVPDDRQPGWRNRSSIAKYDLKTGIIQPLTFGFHNVYVSDISQDGRFLLISTSSERLTQRPTTLTSIYKLDIQTMQTELLVEKDGFISGALFSPDGKQILLSGSPEALNGIGKAVKEGQTPNMFDYQLYLMNLSDKKITPLTKQFDPSVQTVVWNQADNQIYFTAENRDYISLYCLNPKSKKIKQLEAKEDLVNNFSLSKNTPFMAYYGQGVSNSDRLYTMDLKSYKQTLAEDLSILKLKDIQLGECKAWDFINSRGDKIYGRFYLPPYFDSSKKYPLIVNYYGGCSPTSRNFESRYPHHAYAALGYIVYVIEPSGATGFGQEFAARHVNTAGEGVAQDIIEGTKQFCKEHTFVDEKKIGCIGASYGGFMTQYLQTKTDIFAAAISHAGISDHTSYWGEGYWGYSYSEVSMANSYPWSNKELFVDRSPLFNADKIHTPLLFLHGEVDNNVPVGESIQMFTALKLLGRETAFVVVEGQDHHIIDYDKRIQWQNTIYAWFAKWLKNDPTWWDAIYKPKSL